MNLKEIRAKSSADLNKELLALRKAQFSLRMQLATQQINKTSEVARLKREVAQVKTILNEKTRATS